MSKETNSSPSAGAKKVAKRESQTNAGNLWQKKLILLLSTSSDTVSEEN